MVRYLTNMIDITANKKLYLEERLNSISGLQIQFDNLKNETGLLSGAIQPQVADEAPFATRPVVPNVLSEKGIGSKIEPEKEKQEQYEYLLEEKYKSIQSSALSLQMARVIRWNGPGLYQKNAHRLLKKISEHQYILTKNEKEEAVLYEDAIPGSNFESLFKLMVSNQQKLDPSGHCLISPRITNPWCQERWYKRRAA